MIILLFLLACYVAVLNTNVSARASLCRYEFPTSNSPRFCSLDQTSSTLSDELIPHPWSDLQLRAGFDIDLRNVLLMKTAAQVMETLATASST